MRTKISLVIITLGLMAGIVFGQQKAPTAPPLPDRDIISLTDLKIQFAECSISSYGEQKYEDKLVARIRQLEKELADLKVAFKKESDKPAEGAKK